MPDINLYLFIGEKPLSTSFSSENLQLFAKEHSELFKGVLVALLENGAVAVPSYDSLNDKLSPDYFRALADRIYKKFFLILFYIQNMSSYRTVINFNFELYLNLLSKETKKNL